ncbi:ArnT family glycosyltransferase [Flavobacterium phycosphaerae]|uniref:ArnT family glycosyltransferase n=1 Tax=Flavobacterium phycosphaerae TaxID=2697515 RepID=UPI00138A6B2D|nr:glycosyltransferase family 39 protein [Flavobacterium phycosphaerae]
MISKLKYEYLLFLIALVWVLFFSSVIQLQAGFSSWGDDSTYLYAAKVLYFNGVLDDSRPMFISAVIGLPFLFGFSTAFVIQWGIIVNFICWLATVLLVFKIIAERWNRQKAFVFAIAFILCIGNLAVAFHLIAEALFVFLLVLIFYLMHKFIQTGSYSFLTLAIAFSFLILLVKPMPLGLVILLLLYHSKKAKKVFTNKYAVVILVSVSMLFFHMYSLKKKYGDFTISYIGSYTYYNYLGARADCLKDGIAYIPGENPRTKHFISLSSHEMKTLATWDLKNQLLNNKVNLLKAYATNLYLNSSKGNSIVYATENQDKTMCFSLFHVLFKAISKLQNIVFTMVGLALAFYCLVKRKQQDVFRLMLSGFIIYVFLISGISSNEGDRFHLAFYPALLILMADFYKNRILKTVS